MPSENHKTSIRTRESTPRPQPVPLPMDWQGRSGQGADSALAHLIEQEKVCAGGAADCGEPAPAAPSQAEPPACQRD